MEDLDEKIIDELKQKAIERVDVGEEIVNDLNESDPCEPEPIAVEEKQSPVKKSKKVRSEKQIAAFEKAKAARAANLKIKKELESEKKAQKKAEKEAMKTEIKERLEKPNKIAVQAKPQVSFKSPEPRYKEQIINNYYYYGDTGNSPPIPKKKKIKNGIKIIKNKY